MEQTIFALSTGALPAAIAIVRISGPDAANALEALVGHVPTARRAGLHLLRSPHDNRILDSALVLFFPGPHSATGEDLAELHLHGGRAVVRSVERALEGLVNLRRAEPGEFTRRALMHGRIDLNEAEGLGDLLAAETESQRRSAIEMVRGGFSTRLGLWRESLLNAAALIEADLDFSDEGDVGGQLDRQIRVELAKILTDARRLLTMPHAEKLREGFRVVLAGPPNCGKSTLLNALVDREAAIVSEIAGTTRDVIDIPVSFQGIAFVLTDTAGLRADSDDTIERIGIERARTVIANADTVLWLGPEGQGPIHPQLIEIAARSDCPDHHPKKAPQAICLSALSGEGISILVQRMVEFAECSLPPEDGFAISERQRRGMDTIVAILTEAQAVSDMVIVGELVRQAREQIDHLVGHAGTEEVLDALFGRFCVGK